MTNLDDLIKEALVFIAQKGWTQSHEGFFAALVTFLGERLGVEYALVDELLPGGKRARTVGLYASGKVVPDVEYDLVGTPCENVMGKTLCCYLRDIQRLFPEDLLLQQMAAESYMGIPLWDSRGNPIGLIAVMGQRPIENREAAEALLQMVAVRCAHELERKRSDETQRRIQAELLRYQKLESVGRLASGVAHDMNNVLAAIMSMTAVLQAQFEGDGAVSTNLDLVLRAAARGRDLVKGLADFSRDQLEDARPLDLNGLIREEAALLGRTTFGKVTVETDLEAALPPVMGEASSLSNALMNLCVNAVDAMPEGGRLVFRSRAAAGVVEVSVQDSGQGMTPEVKARALDPFFTTKPAGRGTGLGLSIVYGAVKAHGGTLDIESEPGAGTRVVLCFPALATQEASGPGAGAPPPTGGRDLNLLLVDDDALILESVSTLCRHAGHRVDMAQSGQEALAKLEAGPAVDLVILDQNMPGLSGLEVLRRIRVSHPELPVILCTGHLMPEAAAALRVIPRTWLLQKPFGFTEIQAAFRQACP